MEVQELFMLVVQGFLLVGSLIGACAVIEKFFKNREPPKLIQRIFTGHLTSKIETMQTALDGLCARVGDIEMWNYRRLIDDKQLDVEVRVTAGEEYLARGWNGPYQAKVDALREKYKQELRDEGYACGEEHESRL